MPQTRAVDVGDAASRQKTVFTVPRFFISDMCELALMIFLITVPWYYFFYDLPPQFSVQLAPAGGRGLNASSAPAASAFHVMLHASNRRATERCYRNGEVAVTFAGFDVASGRVPGFCVQGKGHREVQFLAREDGGVALPEHLRDRMAAAQKVGALELEVQVRLVQGAVVASSRPMRMWCKPRMGDEQPPDVTMCTVFALQSWFGFDG